MMLSADSSAEAESPHAGQAHGTRINFVLHPVHVRADAECTSVHTGHLSAPLSNFSHNSHISAAQSLSKVHSGQRSPIPFPSLASQFSLTC